MSTPHNREIRKSLDDTDLRIREAFGTDNPDIAYICGGRRRISVNSRDKRARKMLLRKGFRYYSKNQFMLYACARVLPINIFLDVGTNYGECLFSLPLYSRIKTRGFEPNLSLHAYLEKSALHNDDLCDVEVQHLAVSERPGEIVKFFVDTRWSGKSSLYREAKQDIEEVTVETTTVDLEVEKAGYGKTILIKIDVEGFEPSVLRGASGIYEENTNLIYLMEFDENFLRRSNTIPEAFFNELKARYEVSELRGGGLAPIGSYDELKSLHVEKKKVHTDLIMTRFCDHEVREKFHAQIQYRPFKELRAELW